MLNHETVADYVLGAVPVLQRELIARRRLHDLALDSEICTLEALLSAMVPGPLALARPSTTPCEDLWRRVCDVVAREQCMAGCAPLACLDGSWDRHGPGIETRTLWSEKSLLIRCQPGAFEAAHPQPADEHEHIVVIAGDLVIGGRRLAVGDYLRIPAAGLHGAMHTQSGCLLFTQYEPIHPD